MAVRIAVRGGVLYLRGTVIVAIGDKKASRTVYRSLRRAAVAPGARAWAKRRAEQYERALERRLECDLIEGPRQRPVTWRDAYRAYRQNREAKLAASGRDSGAFDLDIDTAWRMTEWFAGQGAADDPLPIAAATLNAYFRENHLARGHKLPTMKRAESAYCAVMNYQVRAGKAKGDYPRPTLPKHTPLAEPVNKWLYPDEIRLFIRLAPKHLRPMIAVLFGTGRRGGELVHLPKSGFKADEGYERLEIGRTKNGLPVSAALPASAVRVLKASLRWRRMRYGAADPPTLFVTDKGDAYAVPKRQRGTLIKKGWRALRARVAAKLEKDGLRERAAVVRRATPHWARHNAASHLFMAGKSAMQVMKHLGWQKIEMTTRYSHLSPEAAKAMAEELDFGAPAVQRAKTAAK